MPKRLFVLGIDGFPFSFLNNDYFKQVMPYFCLMCRSYMMKKIKSVYPVVSSVAWTSFATGSNPGQHGIYGFTDRNVDPFSITLPTSENRKKQPIWEALKTKSKKIVINVPLTYPPEKINGYMVSCFLCPDINKSTYPVDFHRTLKEKEYIIDTDAWLVSENPIGFLKQLIKAMEKRFEIANLLLNENWDYFQLHIMETDRLFHFFIDYVINKKDGEIASLIKQFFNKLDKLIFMLINSIISNSAIMILSDHGFCEIKEEIQLNKWLEENGYLKFSNSRELENYDSETICYALTPGRIYLNLAGREENGKINSSQYQNVRKELKEKLNNWVHPITKDKIVDEVLFCEDIYNGKQLYKAPDIIVQPNNGYDFKSNVNANNVFTKSALKGMHTYDDAMILGINIDVSKTEKIEDVYSIMEGFFTDETI